jgi:hypothetical protein
VPPFIALKDFVVEMQQKENFRGFDKDRGLRQNNEKMAVILTTSRILQQPRSL